MAEVREKGLEAVTLKEIIQLGAVDSIFFSRTFFPNTTRQGSPDFHRDMWGILDNPRNRYVNIQVFRGGAKTSTLRMYTAKRIGYGLAHTILYIGKSEGHAARSVNWLRRQVEHNRLYSTTFSLRPGAKWQDMEAEIIHGTDEFPVWILGMGITGSVRGINRDDYRPDLIVMDDVADEENTSSPEQRQKTNVLIYGAIKESLAPASEAPHAKLVALQTPLNREDYSTLALGDPEWASARYGCWTKNTEDLPISERHSIWPERFPTETLLQEREGAIHRNQLSIWVREKECKLITPETSAFKSGWLRYYDTLPEGMVTALAIDPVPPPSDVQIAKGLRGKDYEALAVVGKKANNFYLVDYVQNRGHEPNWTIAKFFEFCLRYKPRAVLVEAVAYQRTLAWILEQAMRARGQYWTIVPIVDTRKSKFNRIVDGISGPASNGAFFVSKSHSDFISQYSAYPDVTHDDLLESVAVGISAFSEGIVTEMDYKDIEDEEKDVKPLKRLVGGLAP